MLTKSDKALSLGTMFRHFDESLSSQFTDIHLVGNIVNRLKGNSFTVTNCIDVHLNPNFETNEK